MYDSKEQFDQQKLYDTDITAYFIVTIEMFVRLKPFF